jgi:hypothetical protein
MFNSGIRGRRAKDTEGIINPQSKYLQVKSPIPTITSYTISGVDDTALDTAGGQTIVITGTGFVTGVSAVLAGTQIGAVSLISSTQISFTTPAKSAGTYALVVYNSSGGAAILVPGVVYSGFPTFLTISGSIGTVYETNAISTSVSAPSDSSVTYTLASGTLPAGATLNSNGTITGTAPVDAGSTTYTFAIKATDAELQDVTRTFTITVNTDVVTWATPVNGATINLDGTTAYSQVLNATSAAGKIVTYTADTLPAGITLTSGTISGIPTLPGTVSTVLTATASISNRTKTNAITWIVTIGDLFFKYTTMLLNGVTTNTSFVNDASLNNSLISVAGDTKPTTFSPYNAQYYSVNFAAKTDYLSVPATTALTTFIGDFTFECWVYPADPTIGASGAIWGIWDSRQSGATASAMIFGLTSLASPVTGSYRIIYYYSGTTYYGTGIVLSYQWTHIAYVRVGSTMTFYINGVAGGTATISGTQTGSATSNPIYIGTKDNGLAAYGSTGAISNFRIVNGTAVYNGNFTPSTVPLIAIPNTVLLTCQNNRFVDNGPYNYTITNAAYISPAIPFTSPSSVTINTGNSVYFNGSADYLTSQAHALAQLTSDFTIECWAYAVTWTGQMGIINITNTSSSGSNGLSIYFDTSNKISFWVNGNAGTVTTTATYTTGVWYHIALVRSGSTNTLYINGVSAATGSATPTWPTTPSIGIGRIYNDNTSLTWSGYISNVRIIKGTALYTTTFTPSTTPLTTAFTGMATTGPATALLIGAANSSQSLNLTNNNSVLTSSGDFTIEAWAMRNGISSNQCMGCWSAAGDAFIRLNSGAVGSGSIGWSFGSYTYTAGTNTDGNTFAAIGTWFHVAVARIGTGTNNCSLYINGQLIAQASSTASKVLSLIGSYNNGTSQEWNGYISNLRLSNIGRYSTAFTPSTAPFTNDVNTLFLLNNVSIYPLIDLSSNSVPIIINSSAGLDRPSSNAVQLAGTYSAVSLLTCQSTGTKDNALNGWNLTPSGKPQVVNNNYPFAQTTSTASNLAILGSAYFNASGTYLTVPAVSGYTLGTNNHTIECWYYASGTQQTYMTLWAYASGSTNQTANSYYLNIGASSGGLYLGNGSGGWGVSIAFTSPSLNAWHHTAVVRNGNVFTVFIDGNSVGSGTYAANIPSQASYVFEIGGQITGSGNLGNTALLGYVSDFRFVNGIALYTGNFTTTYQPLTAITNTQLLTLQYTGGATNYGIIDNSSFNNPVTKFGNATQGSLSPYSKTGWSAYFDGSSAYLSTSTPFNTVLPGLANNKVQIECWVNPPTVTGTAYPQGFIGTFAAAAANGRWYFGMSATGYLQFTYTTGTGSQVDVVSGLLLVANTWQHVVVTIDASTPATSIISFYLNGTVGTVSTNNVMTTQTANYSAPTIPLYSANYITLYTGYISNLRVLKNNFTYTGAFTPSSYPLIPTVDTVILACQSNRFIDNSPNPSTLTLTGAPIIYSFSPFGSAKETSPVSYSTYFAGGASDFLTVSTGSGQFTLSGDFTVELWFYDMGTSKTLQQFAYSTSGGFGCGINSYDGNATRKLDWRVVGSAPIYGYSAISLYQWHHAAYVKSGSTFRIYLDGKLEYYNATYSNTLTSTATYIGAANNADANYSFNGYISNFRVIKTAIYTSTNTSIGVVGFTVPTTPLGLTQSSGTNIAALSIPTNGNSVYFNGSTDYLTISATPSLALGGNAYTVECWIYLTTQTTSYGWGVAGTYPGSGVSGWSLTINRTTGGPYGIYWIVAGTVAGSYATYFNTNTWYHVAIVRTSTATNGTVFYINGVPVVTVTDANADNYNGTLYIGSQGAGQYFPGYISNLRITKGVAVYTGTFTTPTAPLAITQSSGTNIVALAGVPTNGNSVYFNGSTSFLDSPSTTQFVFGNTTSFSIEAWVYPLGYNQSGSGPPDKGTIWSCGVAEVGVARPVFGINSSGKLVFGGWNTSYSPGSSTIPLNQWSHVAITFDGTTYRLFYNGAVDGTSTSIINFNITPVTATIGGNPDGTYRYPFLGYISNLRVVKGSAVYTSAFTPSTTPLTTTSQGVTSSQVVMLTCQSTTFTDNSNNNFTLTQSGTPTVNRAWSPFGYTPSLLTAQSTTLIDNSNNNFTITSTGTPFANKTFSPFGFAPQFLTGQSTTLVDTSNNTLVITSAGTTKANSYNPFGYTNNSSIVYTPSIHGGSAYFDGTGDYLTMPYAGNTDFPASSQICFECWVYTSSSNTFVMACRNWAYGNSGPTWAFSLNSGVTPLWSLAGTGSAPYIMATSTLSGTLNSWNHYVFTRDSSNVVRIFVNGVLGTSRTDSQAMTSTTGAVYIGTSSNTAIYSTGYMSDMRLTVGSIPSIYTATSTTNGTACFIPPILPISTSNPNNNSTLLLSFNNAGIADQHSTNIFETVNNPQIASEDPYQGTYYSGYFNGSSSRIDFSPGTFGTNNFTIEFWFYANSNADQQFFNNLRWYNGLTPGSISIVYTNSTTNFSALVYTGAGSDYNYAPTTTVPLISPSVSIIGKWTHVALSRVGGTMYLGVNGYVTSSSLTSNTAINLDATQTLYSIGGYNSNSGGPGQWANGYISNFRIVKGTGLYSTTYSVPSVPLATISGTSLLALANNRNTDISTSNLTLTITAVLIKSFNPFRQNSGKSLSFSGSSQYLSFPTTPNASDILIGDFTFECWTYTTTTAVGNTLIYIRGQASFGAYSSFRLGLENNALYLLMSTTGSGWDINTGDIGSVPINMWNHIVVTRTGTTVRIFINGVLFGTTYTITGALYNAGTVNYIGALSTGAPVQFFTGYIKDLRITRGYVRYTVAFTPPTTALTAY